MNTMLCWLNMENRYAGNYLFAGSVVYPAYAAFIAQKGEITRFV
jgi:hypothetical protein